MAYVLPNASQRIVEAVGPRIIHRQARITTTGSAGSAAGTAHIPLPPGLIKAVAVTHHASGAATTDTVLKADSTDGVTIFTQGNSATSLTARPVGTTAVDEGRAATAATDGFGGGFPIRSGVFVDVAQDDALTEAVIVDLWLQRTSYVNLELVAQSGADGAGVVTRTVDFHGAGNLVALALDFQNEPATTDVVIKADNTSGLTLFTSANSLTDLAPSLLGRPGMDETAAATAATDGTGAGNVFKRGLFIDVADADAFTSSNEKIILELWVEQ